jgi:hypothetical protein
MISTSKPDFSSSHSISHSSESSLHITYPSSSRSSFASITISLHSSASLDVLSSQSSKTGTSVSDHSSASTKIGTISHVTSIAHSILSKSIYREGSSSIHHESSGALSESALHGKSKRQIASVMASHRMHNWEKINLLNPAG